MYIFTNKSNKELGEGGEGLSKEKEGTGGEFTVRIMMEFTQHEEEIIAWVWFDKNKETQDMKREYQKQSKSMDFAIGK